MISLLRGNRDKIPFIGDILFSVLTFPVAFTFMQKWVATPRADDSAVWLLYLYITLAMERLLRAFRLRGQSRAVFVIHLVCAAALAVSGALAFGDLTRTTIYVIALTFWCCMLVQRVLDIALNRRLWSILFNAATILLLLLLAFSVDDERFSLIIVGLVASFSALLSIMILIFSRVRLDILKEIVRKTYAVEIIAGLLVMMVAFSTALVFIDDAFHTFWDALWYCFAIVTTIGFGDLTPTSGIGRLLSAILGVYGIVVVALITSIIVNFYGEMKKSESD